MHFLGLRYHAEIMRTFFRLLLWLSITVLSFQGSAAMAIGQAEGSVHEMVTATAHQYHHATNVGHSQPAEHSGGEHCGKHDPNSAASAHAKCATCTNCCIGGAALPSLAPGFHAPSLTSSPHANLDAAMTSIVPAPLDRPPRASFV
jgi:hypothetical protein